MPSQADIAAGNAINQQAPVTDNPCYHCVRRHKVCHQVGTAACGNCRMSGRQCVPEARWVFFQQESRLFGVIRGRYQGAGIGPLMSVGAYCAADMLAQHVRQVMEDSVRGVFLPGTPVHEVLVDTLARAYAIMAAAVQPNLAGLVPDHEWGQFVGEFGLVPTAAMTETAEEDAQDALTEIIEDVEMEEAGDKDVDME